MSKRRIDPETGKPALTWRESKLADGFVANGGNATRAAVDAGYSPNRASQAAWNVLNRPAVQERISARIAQAQIEPAEAIGSLVSRMRADVTDCFGPDGAFSVDLARQNGLGHLLRSPRFSSPGSTPQPPARVPLSRTSRPLPSNERLH